MVLGDEYPASESLALDWIDCWNNKDLERLISHYHPDIVFTSPRIKQAYYETDGQVGSSDGTIKGTEALKQYFQQGMRSIDDLSMELLHVGRGLGGTVAVVYQRENGTIVTEILRVDQGRIIKAEALYGAGSM